MATFALTHGGGGSAWDWHLVAPALREHGHDAVAVDLPGEDESAGWAEYADAVVRSLRARRGAENATRARRRYSSRGRWRPGPDTPTRYISLSRPRELADRLAAYAAETH